jgi:peptidoglycan/LPS O-acetylase OafA/YrhL
MLKSNKYGKIEGLDSLRFFAFLGVFIFHTIEGFKIGMYGVDFFFVLSSFLITYLSLKEIKSTDEFSRFNFFTRRALRIFPIYFLVVIFSFILLPVIGKLIGESISLPDKKWLYFLFLSNYDTQDSIFALKFLWSIAVEEQFYLMFLLAAPLLKKNLLIVPILFICIWICSLFMPHQIYLHSYSSTAYHLPQFILGMIGGICYFFKFKVGKLNILVLILCFLFCLFTQNQALFSVSISFFFLSIIFIVIKKQEYFQKYFPLIITERLGRLSYGLYVYSGFVITFVWKAFHFKNNYTYFLISLLLLVGIATLSFYYFERYFLQLKRRFRKE